MGTNFPTALDSITRPDPGMTLAVAQHAQRHDDESDAIEALEQKVGIDGSANPDSLDYRVTAVEGALGFSGDAADVAFTPVGTVAATDVQAAIAEVASEKIATTTTSTAGFGFAIDEDDMVSDSATKFPVQQSVKAYVDAHLDDTDDVHPASAITYDPSSSGLVAVDTQAAIDEVKAQIAASGIPGTIFDAAGDLLAASGADTPVRLAKGANWSVLGVNASGALAYMDPRAIPATVNTQVGTTYTLALTDTWVTLNNAAAVTLTVPANATVAFPASSVVDVGQLGAGQVTVAAAGGVTIRTASTLKLRAQYSGASLVKLGTDEWLLVGDLEPLGQTVESTASTSYGFVLADAWKVKQFTAATAVTATIPANASVAFPVGTHIDVAQWGAGQVTIAITSDTLRSSPTAKLRAQYTGGGIVKMASTEWWLTGDLATT